MSEAFPNSNQDEQEYKVTKIPSQTEEEIEAVRRAANGPEYIDQKQMGNGPDYEGYGFEDGRERSSDDASVENMPAKEDAINRALGDAALEGAKEELDEDEDIENAA